ncbi:MAG: type II toxin-antitoxin system VapC family toxin [Luteolibacter sp.]
MKAVFDTNILVDYLNGVEAAKHELNLYDIKLISIITYIELMVGAKNPEEKYIIEGFLASFQTRDVNAAVAQQSISLRKSLRLKVPDAIVYGTAKVEGCLLVTRDTKDLKPTWPDIRCPYGL